jgi:hypothetical protein
MYALKEKGLEIIRGKVERIIPPFIYRYLFNGRGRGGLSFQRRALYVTSPMTWEEFCYLWVPVFFPEVKNDLEEDAFPLSYKKGCIELLSHVLEVAPTTAEHIIKYESCRKGLPANYGQLLRKTHLLWSISSRVSFSTGFLKSIC